MMPVIDEAIRKTIGAVEVIAPKAWDLLVKAQRVNGCVDLATALIGWIGATITMIVLHRFIVKGKGGFVGMVEDVDLLRLFALMGLMVAFVLATENLGDIPKAFARVAAPDVFAAQALIQKAAP